MKDDNNYERSAASSNVPHGNHHLQNIGWQDPEARDANANPKCSFDDTTTYTRVAGTKGLMGSWKDTDVKEKEDRVMVWKAGPSTDSIR